MKITTGRIDSVLKRPDPHLGVLLIYGPDAGLVRERAETAVAALVGGVDDPFRVATLQATDLARDPARLADEMAAQSLTGGRRAIRVLAAGDALTGALKPILERSVPDGNLMVIEAGALPPRSSLRKLCEGSAGAAAIACYAPDPEDIAGLVRTILSDAGLALTRDAEAYLADSLAADRALIRREAEKLIAYAGDCELVDLETAEACVGDSAERSMDDLVLAAGDGDTGTVDRTLRKLSAEGVSPVAVLRAAQRHFGRLHLASCRVEQGDTAENVMKTLRPPVFFKAKPRFRRQLETWRRDRLAEALERLVAAEADCKRTGMPAESLCGRVLMQIAAMSRRRA